jgi:hypothetical protein
VEGPSRCSCFIKFLGFEFRASVFCQQNFGGSRASSLG